MNNSKLLMVSLATIMALSGCNIKDPDDITKDMQKKLEEDNKKNDEILDSVMESLERGGQPGSIKVSGVIVKDDSSTDVRITVLSRGGVGKNGTEAPIANLNKPVFKSKNEELDLSKISEGKSLISLGCDEKAVVDLAKERSLEIQKLPAPISKDVMIISAKTIVLCGKVNGIQYPFLTFNADELILDQTDYTQTGLLGSLKLNANKLLLLGSNTIASKGVDTSMTVGLTASLELNVLKEISSNDDGKLLLMSVGSNYKADDK